MAITLIALPLLALFAEPTLDQLDTPEFRKSCRGGITWVWSPHRNLRPADTIVDTIVLHHTAGDTLRGCVKWFQMPESQVSAHYVVDRDGFVVQQVSTGDRAWHAGRSIDSLGRENVNNFSVGIEIVNKGDGKDPWPDAQVDSVVRLCRTLMTYRFKHIKQITSHEFIAEPQGRKNDPIHFPWERLEPLAKDFGVRLAYGLKPKP